MKRKKISLGLLFLMVALVVAPGALAYPTQNNACTDCHTYPPAASTLKIVTNITTITVAPGQQFSVLATWSGGLTTTIDPNAGATAARWPNSLTSNPYTLNNSKFNPTPIVSNYVLGTPSPGGTLTSTLTAPATAGTYTVRVYVSDGDGSPVDTNYADIKVTVVAVAANGTIKGKVTNVSSALPISSATVSAGGQSSVTDVNGNYTISIAPGTYTVTATAAGYNAASTSGIAVTSGATTVQNFALTPIVVQIVNGTIKGKVTNVSSALPISGATVSAGGQSSVTDVNGNYSISIAPGTYTVTATTAGYNAASTSGIAVTSGATTVQNFALTPIVKLINGTIMGRVTDASSALPISGATVSAGGRSSVTDINGNYTISIAAGTYTVKVTATGYSTGKASGITVISGATTIQNFALRHHGSHHH
jgi:hypothetical protein